MKTMSNPIVRPLNTPDPIAERRLSVVDPLQLSNWDLMVEHCPRSSFFHRRAWAQVLNETYGHRPYYFCHMTGADLEELLPVMEVSSLATGRRGISLPFTDSCPSLGPDDSEPGLYELALTHACKRRWRYLELRGRGAADPEATPSLAFYGHVLNLEPGPDELFKSLDSDERSAIRKAKRGSVSVEFNNDLESVRSFYALHCRTRRRHGVPPQPFRFFENIARFVLQPGHGIVGIARRNGQPVAAGVFFHHLKEVIYKFGASDYDFQHLRPNNLLLWESIVRYSADGFTRLDFGRTGLKHDGLRRFKLGFGAKEQKIEYYKYDFRKGSYVTDVDRSDGWMNHVFRLLPPPVLRIAGGLLYPHLS